MATSVIKQKYHYVDKIITTGTETYYGYYYAEDTTYHAGNAISATVIIGAGNVPSFVMMMENYATRVMSMGPNIPVTVRFLLKD